MTSQAPSRTLRATQRSWRFFALYVAFSAGMTSLAFVPGAREALRVAPFDVARAVGAALAMTACATVLYHSLGEAAFVYRLVSLFETCTLQAAFLWLVWRSGRGDSFFWLPYIAIVTLNSGITEHRQGLMRIYVAAPLILAAAFVGLRGDLGAAVLCVAGAALAALVFGTGIRVNLRLSAAIEERERMARELGELRVRDERSRIARDLHDGVGADLAALAWRAQRLGDERANEPLGPELAALTERATQGIDDLRSVVWALRAPHRRWDELVAYVQQRCEELCAERAALTVVDRSPEVRAPLSGDECMHVVRATQELVRNALRHGRASRVSVTMGYAEALVVAVEDDGVGVPDEALARSAGGIANVRARAEQLGGRAAIATSARGTRVELSLPIAPS